MQERIFQLLFEQDDITWQSIIYDLVKKEQMDPWDINISLLTQKYIGMLKTLKEMDFRVSGKVVLAAAILLKIKSTRLVGEDILELDRLLYPSDDIDEEQFFDDLNGIGTEPGSIVTPELIPRTPQPRKRKVSIYDLIGALEQALEVKRRRVMKSVPPMSMDAPHKKVDISQVIKHTYSKILNFFSRGKKVVTFTDLVDSDSRRDKVMAFIPLLHLSNQRKVDLWQARHFGEIEVMLANPSAKKEIEQEVGEASG